MTEQEKAASASTLGIDNVSHSLHKNARQKFGYLTRSNFINELAG
jgi:hypothetical protein